VEIHIEGFEALLRRVVQEELAAHYGGAGGWLDARQAAAYLSVSVSVVHNLVSTGSLPRHGKPGTRLRFRRADLDEYVEARR
jgi:excisionase family DNA binding protein